MKKQENLEKRVERLRTWSYAAEMLPASTVNEKLEPGAAFPDPEIRIAHFLEESWTDDPALTKTSLKPQRNGARTLFGEGCAG